MLQTAYGALTDGLDVRPGQSLLIRGGTSSVGRAAAVLAKSRGLTVLSTTRSEAKADGLRALGVDEVLVDDGELAGRVHDVLGDGVDAALELVGTPTLPDTLRATRRHGVVCFAGMLSNRWTVPDFSPLDHLPRGVRLTAYAGEARDLPADVLQRFLDDVAAGRATVPLGQVFPIERIRDAHSIMEGDRATGKIVVLPRPLRWRPPASRR
jgi:NADPH:quinone reductase-like Zn-dependent oxidoreductase